MFKQIWLGYNVLRKKLNIIFIISQMTNIDDYELFKNELWSVFGSHESDSMLGVGHVKFEIWQI